jgi:hypothetical protein
MISKGNRHNNGAKLARYMMTGNAEKGERAEFYELRGFGEADNILDAFRDLELMAEATKAENALFHVQVRLPDGEQLTHDQWEYTADRIEKRLGLSGQGRAIYFHVNEQTGDRHMHVAWSLIDAETMTAKSLPFFKSRLKAISRELEEELNLTRVTNERKGPIKYAATKNEQQQAQRLGVDKEALRNTIRACWDRSDSGHGFDIELAQEGLILAQGERRDYVVIDPAGGLHALGKRILDVSAKQVRDRLADLHHENIPTIQQAREFMLDLPRDRAERLTREIAETQKQLEAERSDTRELDAFLAAELFERMQRDPASFDKWQQYITPTIAAEMQTLIAQEERQRGEERKRALQEIDQILADALAAHQKKYPNHYQSHYAPHVTPGIAAEVEKLREAEAAHEYARHDPAHEQIAWEDALAKAAIEKEKTEGQFIAPEHREKHGAGGQQEKKQQPAAQPRQQQAAMPENLRGVGAQIWTALHRSDNAKAFVAALDHSRIALAAVTEEEANRSHIAAAYPKAIGRFASEYRAGEIVAVTEQGQVYQFSRRNTGMERKEIEVFLAPLDRSQLQGIEATKESQHQRLCERHWPTMPPQPEATKTTAGLHIQDAAHEAAQPEKAPVLPARLKGTAAQIWTAYNIRIHMQEREQLDLSGNVEKYQVPIQVKGGRDPYQFGAALEEKNMALARVTKDEAERSQKEAAHWKTHGERRPSYQEGEFVVITPRGDVYQLNRRTTGQDAKQVQSFLEKADWKGLTGIEGTKQIMQTRADERAQQRQAVRDQIYADRMDCAGWISFRDWAPTRYSKSAKAPKIEATSSLVFGAAGKALEIASNALESLLAPKLTPQQKHEGEISRLERQANADATVDFSRYAADRAQQRQNDQAQQAARDRQGELEREP